MRGATFPRRTSDHVRFVSIHAPHAGRDRMPTAREETQIVSIHAPHAGRDRTKALGNDFEEAFQSTRPMRGATCSSVSRSFFGTGFNPRAPCGARRELLQRRGSADCFNPRAPCGARPFASMMMPLRRMFQSTRPMRGATPVLTASLLTTKVSIHAPHAGRDTGLADKVRFNKVSIHAPHAGRDLEQLLTFTQAKSFNPRAPCGARLRTAFCPASSSSFQSTRPMRGATAKEVTTSLLCHAFMGIPLHKYDFLGT